MGHFSELAIEQEDVHREDRSYPPPEAQLRWRIADLRSRLEDISKGRYGVTAHYYMGCRFSEDELAFAPPEYFSSRSDVMDAIAIAEERLASIEAEKARDQAEEAAGRIMTRSPPLNGEAILLRLDHRLAVFPARCPGHHIA